MTRHILKMLLERMSFNQLVAYSEPKRLVRSLTVRGSPLQVSADRQGMYYTFNVKAYPSTTGLRHKGFIKFFKSSASSARSLSDVECHVDCDCPDFKYRFAWANKQRGSSSVGPSSMNQAINRAPRITNPQATPGLCKHLLALRDYIKGQASDQWVDAEEEEVPELLSRLVNQSRKLWIDYKGAVSTARQRDTRLAAGRKARRDGAPLPDKEDNDIDVHRPPEEIHRPKRDEVPDPEDGPPAPPTPERGPVLPSDDDAPPKLPKKPSDGFNINIDEPPDIPNKESVDRTELMSKPLMEIEDILKDVSDIADVETSLQSTEPDVDSSEATETEGDQALDLLSQIRDLLQQMVGEEEPEEGEPEEGEPEEGEPEEGEPEEPSELNPDDSAIEDEDGAMDGNLNKLKGV